VTPHANLKLAVPAIVFSAVGTAGQRCTTTRRLIVHQSIAGRVTEDLLKAYGTLRIGSPLDERNHVGPLIDRRAVATYLEALQALRSQGGSVLCGGRVLDGPGCESGCYVEPVVATAENDYPIVQQETFAPILYVIEYSGSIDNAIALHNDVPRGCRRRSSPTTCGRPRSSCRRPVRTAASPTSISARRGRKSAGPSAARRKPAAAGNRARMPGRATCGGRPTPSTTARPCRWPRGSASSCSAAGR